LKSIPIEGWVILTSSDLTALTYVAYSGLFRFSLAMLGGAVILTWVCSFWLLGPGCRTSGFEFVLRDESPRSYPLATCFFGSDEDS
jgi:hypothetical protein